MARGVHSTIVSDGLVDSTLSLMIHQTIMMVSIKIDCIKVTSREMIDNKAKKSTTNMTFSRRRSTNGETQCPRTMTFV